MSSSTNCIIEEGNHVLLKKADNLRLFQVKRKREIWLDKTKFYLDGVIGHPFGTTFEVKDGQMAKVTKTPTQDVDSSSKGIDQDKDNRHLHDLDSNQKLTADEIDQMKKEGVTGEKLIEQLIENSTTFQTKTEFAQEKWVKKKKKKHIMEFTVLKPTSRLLCEMYWSKKPSKICNLRIDTLGQILTWGNVRANSTVAVVDTCLCLVTGAVLERLGGFGKVISFYTAGCPISSPLEAYDFSTEIKDTLYYFPLELVNSLNTTKIGPTSSEQDIGVKEEKQIESVCGETEDSTDVTLQIDTPGNDKKSDSCITDSNEKTDETEETVALGESGEVTQEDLNGARAEALSQSKESTGKKRKRDVARENRKQDIERARRVLSQGNIDCLIVACKFHPTPIVMALVDLLAPSRQVVVFSQFKEALEDCYVYMREHGGLVSYRLTETWLRDYQVLPNRTHPKIQMSGTGGYLLTATTVVKHQT